MDIARQANGHQDGWIDGLTDGQADRLRDVSKVHTMNKMCFREGMEGHLHFVYTFRQDESHTQVRVPKSQPST